MKAMGKRIRDKREECRLTMEELGEKVGVSRQAICKWEKGDVKRIDREHIDCLARIFHCSPAWLMGFNENEDDVTLTYESPGRETVSLRANSTPIIGMASKRAELYNAAIKVKPENIDVAIDLLKTLS